MMEKARRFIDRLIHLFSDIDFTAMVVLSILFALFCYRHAHAKDVRTVKLDQATVARVFVSPGRSTILSFPSKPAKVILGNQGVFAVEYIENDLAIAALSGRSRSNLFVYLEGRRFAFDLEAVPGGGDTIVLVRDAIEGPKTDTKPPATNKPVKPRSIKQTSRAGAREGVSHQECRVAGCGAKGKNQ